MMLPRRARSAAVSASRGGRSEGQQLLGGRLPDLRVAVRHAPDGVLDPCDEDEPIALRGRHPAALVRDVPARGHVLAAPAREEREEDGGLDAALAGGEQERLDLAGRLADLAQERGQPESRGPVDLRRASRWPHDARGRKRRPAVLRRTAGHGGARGSGDRRGRGPREPGSHLDATEPLGWWATASTSAVTPSRARPRSWRAVSEEVVRAGARPASSRGPPPAWRRASSNRHAAACSSAATRACCAASAAAPSGPRRPRGRRFRGRRGPWRARWRSGSPSRRPRGLGETGVDGRVLEVADARPEALERRPRALAPGRGPGVVEQRPGGPRRPAARRRRGRAARRAAGRPRGGPPARGRSRPRGPRGTARPASRGSAFARAASTRSVDPGVLRLADLLDVGVEAHRRASDRAAGGRPAAAWRRSRGRGRAAASRSARAPSRRRGSPRWCAAGTGRRAPPAWRSRVSPTRRASTSRADAKSLSR